MEAKLQKWEKCLKLFPPKPYALGDFIEILIILAFTDFMFSIFIAQRTWLIWQFVRKKKQQKMGFIAELLQII